MFYYFLRIFSFYLRNKKKYIESYLNNILFNYRLHDNQESAALIVSMEKYQEMYSLLVTMNSYTDAKMKRKILRYKYFIFTIIFDVMSDVVHMRIMQGFGKIKFCIKLNYTSSWKLDEVLKKNCESIQLYSDR